MERTRPGKAGSFASDLGELIKHFPLAERQPLTESESRKLQEKRDIHAMLFEQAWRLDSDV